MTRALLALALALLVALVVLASRSDEPFAANMFDAVEGPAFVVRVVKPRANRPLLGILPAALEAELAGEGALRFGHESPGATVGAVGPRRLELGAEGWRLRLVAGADGALTAESRLVFPIVLAERDRVLHCRPDDPVVGSLELTSPPGGPTHDGRFVVELGACASADTGEPLEWPSQPLTVHGLFKRLSAGDG